MDEIENGMHYSVLKEVWKTIATAAREADVQVFATTHSLECARAAHPAFSEIGPYDFRLHRLKAIGGNVTAVTLGEDEMQAAVEFNWTVR